MEIYRYEADDFIVIYEETYIGFEIKVKKNDKAEIVGFCNVIGYEDALKTACKFDTHIVCPIAENARNC